MEVSAIAAEQDLRQAAAGDTSAFELLLAPLLDPAYRLATVMLGDRGAAEDAVQEASVKAWRKLGGFRGAAPELQAWFFSIVANECRMTRRRRWWSVFKFADLPRSEARVRRPHRAARFRDAPPRHERGPRRRRVRPAAPVGRRPRDGCDHRRARRRLPPHPPAAGRFWRSHRSRAGGKPQPDSGDAY